MVIVLERTIRDQDKNHIREFLTARGYTIREIVGQEETILGAVGTSGMDLREVELLPGVARVIPISSPYKLASREFRKEDTVISIRGPAGIVRIGGLRIIAIARSVRRGKPRTDHGMRGSSQGIRSRALPWGRVEAAHFPLRVSGSR